MYVFLSLCRLSASISVRPGQNDCMRVFVCDCEHACTSGACRLSVFSEDTPWVGAAWRPMGYIHPCRVFVVILSEGSLGVSACANETWAVQACDYVCVGAYVWELIMLCV